MSEDYKNRVISLYDFTGAALRPWAKAGYDCYAYDIQHDKDNPVVTLFPSGGSISYIHSDLHNPYVLVGLQEHHKEKVAFLMGWPVCTDMAVSGARHFAAKGKKDPLFQQKAAGHAKMCGLMGDMFECAWMVENPVSVLSRLWRKPNYIFQPWHYGGYIPEDEAAHPTWPDYIAPRDAYPKTTCIWSGGGFKMPHKRPVFCPSGWSLQTTKLGGKSQKTKNIRSAGPRGFLQAVFEANHQA